MDTAGAENSCRENDVNTNTLQTKSQLPKTKVGIRLSYRSDFLHVMHPFLTLLFQGA